MGTIKADALAKAALQATARAVHTAQLAHEEYKKSGPGEGAVTAANGAELTGRLRDKLLDAYQAAPEGARRRILATTQTITSDELIDLLAMCVKG